MYFSYNLNHRPVVIIAGIVMSGVYVWLCGFCSTSFKRDFTVELITFLL